MFSKTRATNLEVKETRRVLHLIRPFLTALGRWNSCVPTHLAVLASRHTSGAEKGQALASLQAVLNELCEIEIAFAEATKSGSTHSRVEDVRLSMQRLRARISPVVELFGFEDRGKDAAAQRTLPQPHIEAAISDLELGQAP